MIVGGYDLHLYCDGRECRDSLSRDSVRFQFAEPKKAQAFAAARKYGWRINEPHQLAICPICVEKGIRMVDVIKAKLKKETP